MDSRRSGSAPAAAHAASGRELAAAALVATAVLVLHGVVRWQGVVGWDASEYACCARNLLRGHGVSSQLLYPVEFRFWTDPLHPKFIHPPGMPWAIAGSFLAFGQREFAAVLPAAAGFVAAATAAFALAARVFGRTAAWTALGFVVTCREFLDNGMWAVAETPAAALVAAAFLLLFARTGTAAAVAAGVLCAASAWFRELAATLAPAVVLTAALAADGPLRARAVRGAAAAAGFAVGLLPLVVRSLAVTGKPWFSYSTYALQAWTKSVPSLDNLRDLDCGTFAEFDAAHPGEFGDKVVANLTLVPGIVPSAVGVAMTAAAALALLLVPRLPRTARVLTCGTVVAVAGVAASSVTFLPLTRYFLLVTPLIAVLAGGAVGWVAALRPRLAGLVVAAALAWPVRGYVVALSEGPEPDGIAALRAFVAERTDPASVIATDVPEATLWANDRRTVYLPLTAEQLERMRGPSAIRYVLLTSRRCRTDRFRQPWAEVLDGRGTLAGWEMRFEGDVGPFRAKLLEHASR